jgi:hypothetical protein
MNTFLSFFGFTKRVYSHDYSSQRFTKTVKLLPKSLIKDICNNINKLKKEVPQAEWKNPEARLEVLNDELKLFQC